MMKKGLFVLLVLLTIGLVACSQEEPKEKTAAAPASKTRFVTIGTGGITGVYYPTGGAICKTVNTKKDAYNLRCTVESTGGSVFNINAVMAGDLDFGVTQSDRQYQAVKGTDEWKDKGAQADLRAVFSIHPEAITLLVADDTGIKAIADLKGKVINIGNFGSGTRLNSIDALATAGLAETDLTAESVKPAEAPSLLQDGRLDGFFYTVGHPSGAYKEATAGKRLTRFIDIEGPGVDKMIADNPFYAKAIIPKSFYPSATNEGDVKTFGVKATLVTSAKVPDDVVYAITKEVFENFDAFKALHPAFEVLTKESMLEGLSAPIHPGAMKYYKEAGLM
ncbi:MAG: TAXI family TRAP transporter solute-binding subunit [Desulfovibrionaceae bacterium]